MREKGGEYPMAKNTLDLLGVAGRLAAIRRERKSEGDEILFKAGKREG